MMAVNEPDIPWQQAVQAFRQVATELTNSIAACGELLAVETLPDLELDLPMLTIAPFARLADGPTSAIADDRVMVMQRLGSPQVSSTSGSCNQPASGISDHSASGTSNSTAIVTSPAPAASSTQTTSALPSTASDLNTSIPTPIFSLRPQRPQVKEAADAIASPSSLLTQQLFTHSDHHITATEARESVLELGRSRVAAASSRSESQPSLPESLQLLNSLTDDLLRSQSANTLASTLSTSEQSIQTLSLQSANSDSHSSSSPEKAMNQPLGAIATTSEVAYSSPLLPSLEFSQRSPQDLESTGSSSSHLTTLSNPVKLPNWVHSASLPSGDSGAAFQSLGIETVSPVRSRISARQLADWVNEVLIEQAQRQGVDLF